MLKKLHSFDIKGKNVLIRTDFNVPISNDKVTNNYRIKAALPTIKACIESGSGVVIMSHLGRPKGKPNSKLSLMPVGEELASLLEMPIKFSLDCISTDAIDTSISLKPGEIHLLENLRFHDGEENNSEYFSSQLARHGQIFINDAFGTAHRSHASNVGVVSFFKNAGIGFLMDKELNYLDRFMVRPKRPFTLIVGGSKIISKLKLIENFLDKTDNIIIGGGMAFTFLKARGKKVGGSIVEETMIQVAKRILNKARVKGVKFFLPTDAICGKKIDDKNPKGSFQIQDIPNNLMGLDLGPESIIGFNNILSDSNTILWNGPMGVFESKDYEIGTKEIAMHLVGCLSNEAKVIVGGGDTAAAIESFGLLDEMTHVSTGGGSSLELLSGESLNALQVLER